MSLQYSLTAASALDKTFRLKLNSEKTEVLCWLPGGGTESFATEIHIGNSALKIVRDFKYLGTYVFSDCRMERSRYLIS